MGDDGCHGVFVLLLNPIYNIGTAAFAVSKPANVHDSFNFVGEHISSEKAEQILKSFFLRMKHFICTIQTWMCIISTHLKARVIKLR